MSSPRSEVTRLLESWNQGDPEALPRLIPLVFDDLRSIARGYFAREDADHTLQPTALVHEVYVRLSSDPSVRRIHWEDSGHFFRIAARMMRRLLVDHARYRHAKRRGGEGVKVPLDEEIPLPIRHAPEDVLAVDEALERLQALKPRQSEVVELKFFGGLTIEEIGEVLEIKPTTVKQDWKIARAWLVRELRNEP
jgi:RNA polymerase sigma factor (TIGR02999 family)